MFGETFEETETYTAALPRRAYVERIPSDGSFIALAAVVDASVVGGLAAYDLMKFESERSGIYVYDVAVARSLTAARALRPL